MRFLLILFAAFAAACSAPAEEGASPPPSAEERATSPPTEVFDAEAAWEEFEGTLRLFYAYLERSDFDVDAHFTRVEALAGAAPDRAAFRKILHQSTYAFTDPHLIVGAFTPDDFNIIPTSSDLQVALQAGGFVVVDVRAGSAADLAGVRPGWRVASVGGVSIEDALREPFGETLPNPTSVQMGYAATLVANGKREGGRTIVFQDGNETKSIALASPRDFAREVSKREVLDVRREGRIGIIRPNNSLGNNELIFAFDEALRNLSSVDGLVIDLRNTPSGGNTEVARSIIGHFVTETRPYQVHEIPSLEREFTVPRRFIEQVKPRAPYFDPARTVVLGGYWTGSMGEGLVIGLDGAAGVHTIASDMGDLLGGLSNRTLQASGARLDLGTEALFHIDGTPREDYVADTSLTSADRDARGNDPALRVALFYLLR